MQTQAQWPAATTAVRPGIYEKRDAVALLIDNVAAAFALGYQGDASMDAAICGALGALRTSRNTRTQRRTLCDISLHYGRRGCAGCRSSHCL
jgi:hypothetical protein